jgi:hypothetical protein
VGIYRASPELEILQCCCPRSRRVLFITFPRRLVNDPLVSQQQQVEAHTLRITSASLPPRPQKRHKRARSGSAIPLILTAAYQQYTYKLPGRTSNVLKNMSYCRAGRRAITRSPCKHLLFVCLFVFFFLFFCYA